MSTFVSATLLPNVFPKILVVQCSPKGMGFTFDTATFGLSWDGELLLSKVAALRAFFIMAHYHGKLGEGVGLRMLTLPPSVRWLSAVVVGGGRRWSVVFFFLLSWKHRDRCRVR